MVACREIKGDRGGCPACKIKDAVIEELRLLIRPAPHIATVYLPMPPSTTANGTSVFDRCPCNPKNGGSGICGCINGSPQVTC